MQETQVLSLGWEDPLEEEIANPLKYSCLEEIPRTEEPGGLQSMGLQERHNWATNTFAGILDVDPECMVPFVSKAGSLSWAH